MLGRASSLRLSARDGVDDDGETATPPLSGQTPRGFELEDFNSEATYTPAICCATLSRSEGDRFFFGIVSLLIKKTLFQTINNINTTTESN